MSELIVKFIDQTSPFVRGARGRYVSAQAQLAASNKKMAIELQALVVRYISNQIERPQVSTDRLIHVTAAAGNAKSQPGGWQKGIAVGIPEFLDNSISKYWRTIEEGSEVTWRKRSFIGLELPGVFGASLSGLGTGRYGSRAFAGGPFTNPGKGSGGKFVPRTLKPGVQAATVKHNIRAQYSYMKAWEAYDGGGRVNKDLHTLLEAIGGNASYSASGSGGSYGYGGHFHGFGRS